jgi:hypothetical protein
MDRISEAVDQHEMAAITKAEDVYTMTSLNIESSCDGAEFE